MVVTSQPYRKTFYAFVQPLNELCCHLDTHQCKRTIMKEPGIWNKDSRFTQFDDYLNYCFLFSVPLRLPSRLYIHSLEIAFSRTHDLCKPTFKKAELQIALRKCPNMDSFRNDIRLADP